LKKFSREEYINKREEVKGCAENCKTRMFTHKKFCHLEDPTVENKAILKLWTYIFESID
jgi:hypothetical protein